MKYERSHPEDLVPVPRPPETADVVSVDDAAAMLGISPSAVRKRIARGQLEARKVEGRWQIMVESDGLQTTSVASDGKQPQSITQEQLYAIRDEWLQPVLLQIGAQAELIGRLEERCRAIADERDFFRAECHRMRAELEARSTAEPDPAPTAFGMLMNIARQLLSVEGAVVAGIALAIALWVGVGLLTWLALG